MVFAGGNQKTVIGKRRNRIEIEYKNQVLAPERQDFIFIVVPHFMNSGNLKVIHGADETNHCFVKIAEKTVFQIRIIDQVPLTTGLFVRPSVAFSRKINPFGMPEFISHKIKVSAVDGGSGD